MGKEKVKRGRKGEEGFLENYDATAYPRPSVTVDLVILTIVDAELRVLLVKRREHPFRGAWALPGGFVRVGASRQEQGEDLDAAAARELTEETGLPAREVFLEQLRAFGKPGRDPRTRVITIAYYALVRPDLSGIVRAGGDAADAEWVSIARVEAKDAKVELAFDHREIVGAALRKIRGDLERSEIAFQLVPPTFTIPELRAVHEAVMATTYDAGNFRRRFLRMLEEGLLEEAPGKRVTASKPARVYRFASKGGASAEPPAPKRRAK